MKKPNSSFRDLSKVIRVLKSCNHNCQFEIAIAMFNRWVGTYMDMDNSRISLAEINSVISKETAKELNDVAKKFGYTYSIGWMNFLRTGNDNDNDNEE